MATTCSPPTTRCDLATKGPGPLGRLRRRRRERERQRLRVGARAQRVVGADRLLELDRRDVVADRAGVGQQRRRRGRAADVGEGRRAARACSGDGSENAPLTSWPVAVDAGSATLSVASPAVETVVARRRRRVLARDARRERAEGRRRAQRQRQRRRHRAADAALRAERDVDRLALVDRDLLRLGRPCRPAACRSASSTPAGSRSGRGPCPRRGTAGSGARTG